MPLARSAVMSSEVLSLLKRAPGMENDQIFEVTSGHAARLVPRRAHPADLGRGIRPDLCAVRKLDHDGQHGRVDGGLRQLRPARRRLWHRGLHHDAAHDRAALSGDARALGVVGAGSACNRRCLHSGRLHAVRCEPRQDPRRRLDPACLRRPGFRHHGDMALWDRRAAGESQRCRHGAGRFLQDPAQAEESRVSPALRSSSRGWWGPRRH
jgi:hypothetical protein